MMSPPPPHVLRGKVMLKITIACVGKVKEKWMQAGIEEYTKRLRRYCRLDIFQVSDEKTDEQASPAEEDAVRNKEGQRLLAGIPEQAYVIALEIGGRKVDSERFAARLGEIPVLGNSHIVFVIGGSIGLSREVRQRADEQISFSDMTFPHQLMRVILLEQIYRGFRILNHEPYHK